METNNSTPRAAQSANPVPTAELVVTKEERQIQLLRLKAESEFAMTKVGQEVKRFESLQRMGQMYAAATIVPDTYKNNLANCAIAIDMASRMNANPVMVMQNLYLVHGMPAWSSKFLIATINSCGRFTPLRYECNGLKGDDYGWRCYAYETTDHAKKERLEGTWVTWRMVKAEGWNKKAGSKWLTMPEQMFRYRAAAFWQRMYAPEISMGLSTADEAEDMQTPKPVDVVAMEIDANAGQGQVISIDDTEEEEVPMTPQEVAEAKTPTQDAPQAAQQAPQTPATPKGKQQPKPSAAEPEIAF